MNIFELLYWVVPLSAGFVGGWLLAAGVDSPLLRIGAGVVGAVLAEAVFQVFLLWVRRRSERIDGARSPSSRG